MIKKIILLSLNLISIVNCNEKLFPIINETDVQVNVTAIPSKAEGAPAVTGKLILKPNSKDNLKLTAPSEVANTFEVNLKLSSEGFPDFDTKIYWGSEKVWTINKYLFITT